MLYEKLNEDPQGEVTPEFYDAASSKNAESKSLKAMCIVKADYGYLGYNFKRGKEKRWEDIPIDRIRYKLSNFVKHDFFIMEKKEEM